MSIQITKAQKTLLQVKGFIPFFTNLSNHDVLSITKNVKFMRYKKFEVIFEQGDNSKELFFVINGKINISKGDFQKVGNLERYHNFITIENLSKKGFFGEMAYLKNTTREIRATSYIDGTTLLIFEFINNVDTENANIFINLYKGYIDNTSEKIRFANNKLKEIKEHTK